MDVTAAVGPLARPDSAAPSARAAVDGGRQAIARTSGGIAGDGAVAAPSRARPPGAAPPEDPGVPIQERPLRSFMRELLEVAGARSGDLKFDVVAADVLARFRVDEGTGHVTITMYHRDTGEVIRELPPRGVQDVITALRDGGLVVDVVR